MNRAVKKPRLKVSVGEVLAEIQKFPHAYKLRLVCDLSTARRSGFSDSATRVGGVVAVAYHREPLEGLVSRLERMTAPDVLTLLVALGFVHADTAVELPVLRVVDLAVEPADNVLLADARTSVDAVLLLDAARGRQAPSAQAKRTTFARQCKARS